MTTNYPYYCIAPQRMCLAHENQQCDYCAWIQAGYGGYNPRHVPVIQHTVDYTCCWIGVIWIDTDQSSRYYIGDVP